MSHRMLNAAFGILFVSQAVACDTVTEGPEPRSPVQEQAVGVTKSPSEANAMNVAIVPHAPGAKSASVDSACAGIPVQDREIGPFGDRQQIIAVTPLTETMTHLKFSWNQLRGAQIFMRATPGMTKQWLNRLGHCHLAMEEGVAASGSEVVADPFAVAPLEVNVEDTPQGFVMYLRTEQLDTDVANRVLDAAKQLVASR